MIYYFKFITDNGIESTASFHANNEYSAIAKFKEWWIDWDSRELPNYWIDGIWFKK